MSKKKKKNDDEAPASVSQPRRERIPAPAQGIASAPSNRGKFAVARAQTALAQALPDLIFTKTRKSREPLAPAKPRLQPPPAVSATSRNSGPRKPDLPTREERKPLSLDKLPQTCKPRPASSKGDGGSRSFVPWCKG